MKVTKFPQSCILLEKDGQKIVIDPGMFFAEKYKATDLGKVAAVLYTHEHPDHFNAEIADALRKQGAVFFANASTAKLVGDCRVIADGDSFEAANFNVTAHELPHSLLPDGSPGPQNTGYLIDGIFFDPGDGKELAGLQADAMALPITGPDISMMDAFNFAKQLGVKVAIPVHDRWFGANAQIYSEFAKNNHMPFELRVLKDGESTQL
jgi:L-ascorbate metabolism protein UlaG (beta-lactamase superfamily)